MIMEKLEELTYIQVIEVIPIFERIREAFPNFVDFFRYFDKIWIHKYGIKRWNILKKYLTARAENLNSKFFLVINLNSQNSCWYKNSLMGYNTNEISQQTDTKS
eukprot:Anaeramoba_ignava/c20732_g1_i1.p2 GENE.c20732_g1_i1~~c20732_g1_i1.p2  ORF type:complete len:104 (+),score=9.17 c20732_g1_i1:779-1090(+)